MIIGCTKKLQDEIGIMSQKSSVDGNELFSWSANLVVKLDLGVYTAEKRIVTPIDIKFKQLHKILQIVFDWKECHLHDFDVINENGERVLKIIN